MKKIYLLLTVALAAVLAPLAGWAQGGDVLVPEQSVMGMNALPHRVHYPIRNAGFSFEAPVTVSEGATLYIMRGDEVLAESPLVEENYKTQGRANAYFGEGLMLPKGKTYRMVVKAGAIALKDRPDVTNDELSVDFDVPGTVEPAIHDVAEGEAVEWLDNLTFYYYIETKELGPTEVTLYREGEAVATYPAYTTWDWDLGQTHVYFDERQYFYKGVNYTFVLPAACVSSLYRDDIVNEEIRINFVGAYEGPGTTGVETVESGGTKVACRDGRAVITGLKAGSRVSVCTADGKVVKVFTADGRQAETTVDLPGRGVYVISVDGKDIKVFK